MAAPGKAHHETTRRISGDTNSQSMGQEVPKYQKIPKSTTKKTKSGDVNPQSQKKENCDTSLSHSKNHIMGFGPSENEQGRHRHGV